MKADNTPNDSTQSLERDAHRSVTINRLVRRGGLRARIDAKCCECIYDPSQAGTWRKQVENCTSWRSGRGCRVSGGWGGVWWGVRKKLQRESMQK
jgi:hypothetical protein